jgi:hypothetical protein
MCLPPRPSNNNVNDNAAGKADVDPELATWLAASASHFDQLLLLLLEQHQQKLQWLRGAAAAAADSVWWPFTQHAQLPSR